MSLRRKRLTPLVLALAVLFAAAPASAAVPPLEIAKKRQAALRADDASPVDVSISVTGEGVVEFRRAGVALDGAGPIELTARAKEQTLELGKEQPAPWSVVWVLLTASDPVAELQASIGRIDTSSTSIEPLDDSFVYVFGATPQIALSRDLTHIRRVEFHSGEHRWQLRLDGEVGERGLPAQIHVIRSGEPYANIELSKP